MKTLFASLMLLLSAVSADAQTFAVGANVATTVTASVYSSPGVHFQCTQSVGSTGQIISGPSHRKGQTYWDVNFTTSCDGWVAQNNLAVTDSSPPPPPPPPPGGSTNMLPPTGYTSSQLALEDTFTAFDTTKWNPYMQQNGNRWSDLGCLPSPYSGQNNPASGQFLSYSDPYPALSGSVNINGNHMVMDSTGMHTFLSQSSHFSNCGFSWAGNEISSGGKWTIPATGGYLQIRAKFPDQRFGGWGAIWLLPNGSASGCGSCEFDIIDGGVNRTGAASNTSMDSKWFGTGETSVTDLSVDISAGYHIYGFEYKPGVSFKTYFDGTLLHTWTSGVPTGVAFEVMLTNQMANPNDSGWHSVPDSIHNGPFQMDINDLQLYRLP